MGEVLPPPPPPPPPHRTVSSALQALRGALPLPWLCAQAAALAELFGGNAKAGRPGVLPEGAAITPSITGLCR